MSNFPSSLDDDSTLPPINDNLTEMGGSAINALRDATFAIEENLGLTLIGSTNSLSTRLDVSLQPDGTIKSSALTSLGLVTLPITNSQISNTAAIAESKLALDYTTTTLHNEVLSVNTNANTALGWINTTGTQLAPHIAGSSFNHFLKDISVAPSSPSYLLNRFGATRNNTNSYLLLSDINTDLVTHQKSDGSTGSGTVTTSSGSTYPGAFAHTASGIFLNTNTFTSLPQSIQSIQELANFIDMSSIFLYGSRIQNFYSNGISRVSRSSSLQTDGYGSVVVSSTTAISYLLLNGNNSNPQDDIEHGDDMIEFKPSAGQLTGNVFDSQFSAVRPGDILRINDGYVLTTHIVKEKKYIQSGPTKKFFIRIDSKNLHYTVSASARIDRALPNANKYGVLSVSGVNNAFSALPSLVVGSPRGAQTLGIGFEPNEITPTSYLLYLALYPTGSPADQIVTFPPIDVSGNAGASPGRYTLDSIVENINEVFCSPGYNARFKAFSFEGNFGIMLSDSISKASFSIIAGLYTSGGSLDTAAMDISYPNNVVGITNGSSFDAFGFGPLGSGIASPPYQSTFVSAAQSLHPTKLVSPLKRNNYYVNGVEKEKLGFDVNQILDTNGDGYWKSTIQSINVVPGAPGRVEVTYHVLSDLSTSGLSVGKTLIAKLATGSGPINEGRFIISSVTFNGICTPGAYTDITVYDAVHANGTSPEDIATTGTEVYLYFSSDSVSFNTENASDALSVSPFKRHMEVFVTSNGATFTHERARCPATSSPITVNGTTLYSNSEITKFNIVSVSPKLKGYLVGNITKISLKIISYNDSGGNCTGQLGLYDGSTFASLGPIVVGRKGEKIRFYDETNLDYIEILIPLSTSISTINNQYLDFQLFSTLSLDPEISLIATCQVNDVTKKVSNIVDRRQFGNISEKELSTSALSYLSLPDKILHGNGVVRGFDLAEGSNPNQGNVFLKGGEALVGGKLIQMNSELVVIPTIKEVVTGQGQFNVTWALCVNDRSEYQTIPLLDVDPSVPTPTSFSRLFTAFNPVTSSQYILEAVTFSDLVNRRKDLSLLYLVAATVSGSSISLVAQDARRYVSDSDTNSPLRKSDANSQGNFRSCAALLQWIKYNSDFNGTAIVSGNETINTPIAFSFGSTVIIDGRKNATLNFAAPVEIGFNVTFRNMNLFFNGGLTVRASATNIRFENCNVIVSTPVSTPPVGNIVLSFSAGSKFASLDTTWGFLFNTNVSGGACFAFNTTSSVIFERGYINASFNVTAGSTVPGNLVTLTNTKNTDFKEMQFLGNFANAVKISASDVLIEDCEFSSPYSPGVGPDFGYSSGDFINSGRGYVYASSSSDVKNIRLKNNSFTYESTANDSRFCFINIEFLASNAILSDLEITGNEFVSKVTSTTIEANHAAIAIINQVTNSTATSSQPILRNAVIRNNRCNRNQGIYVTSVRNGLLMKYPGLCAQNVTIEENICGVIGYWISSGTRRPSVSPNLSVLSDKLSSLTIEKNSCLYIANTDHKGLYFPVSDLVSGTPTDFSQYSSGNVVIGSNVCSWIHSGITENNQATLKILNNTLNAFDPAFIQLFSDTTSRLVYSTNYAIYVSSTAINVSSPNPSDYSNSSCLIQGNTTDSGYYVSDTASVVSYNYDRGFLLLDASAKVSHNYFGGLGILSTNADVVLLKGVSTVFTHNKIERSGTTIFSYLRTNIRDLWDGSNVVLMATDNYFDSPYKDSSTLSENLLQISVTPGSSVIVTRNINQTETIAIPITNSIFPYDDDSLLFSSDGNLLGTTNDTNYNSQIYYLHDLDATAKKGFGWQSNVAAAIPSRTKVISLNLGIKRVISTVDTTAPSNNSFSLRMNRFSPSSGYANMDGATIGNDPFLVNNYSTSFDGPALNSTTTTHYLTIDLQTAGVSGADVTHQFVSGNNNGFSASLSLTYKGATSDLGLLVSPLVVKYRW